MIYILIVADVEIPTFIYFFNNREEAIAKYERYDDYGDPRLYQVLNGAVERIYPTRGAVEPVTFGREVMLPF